MLEHALQLLKDNSVASIARTLPRSVRQISSSIDFTRAKLIIEYGPGDGALTEYFLRQMRQDCRLVAIETNDFFIETLRSSLADPRLTLVHESAENIVGIRSLLRIPEADYVVSGIPFSFFDYRLKKEIVRDTASVLKARGKFILYQALTAVGARESLCRALKQYFEVGDYRTLFLNLPPLYVLEGVKRQGPQSARGFTLPKPVRNSSED